MDLKVKIKVKSSKTLLFSSVIIPLFLVLTPGTGIDDFIHVLQSQDLTVEIAKEENITEKLQQNGAIKVSREGQVRVFLLSLQFPHNN